MRIENAAALDPAASMPARSPALPVRRPAAALRWFAAMPVAMLLDPSISSDAKVLAAILIHYDGPTGCHPKVETLMRDMNASKNKVLRLLEELERYGFLVRARRGRNNTYSLRPVYERPIRPDSLEATGELQTANAARPRPAKRNALHKPRSAPSLSAVSAEDAIVVDRSVPFRRARPPRLDNGHVPRMEPFAEEGTADRGSRVPQVEPNAEELNAQTGPALAPRLEPDPGHPIPDAEPIPVLRVEPETAETFHPWHLDTTENQEINKNQQQQNDDAAAATSTLSDGLALLRFVGVTLTGRDCGTLSGADLARWADWVRNAHAPRIENKAAFAAAKIRAGHNIRDIFPDVLPHRINDRNARLHDQAEHKEAKSSAEEDARNARLALADEIISRLSEDERKKLRSQALNDPSVWIARTAGPMIFARILANAERRLATGESKPCAIMRDHHLYRQLPLR